jgi:hypothetical protein
LCALEPEELLPKIVCESGMSVRYNRMRHSMKLENMIHGNMSHCGCCEQVLKRKKMSIFVKDINYTMMTDLLSNLGKSTMKYIEMSLQIAGGIESSCSVPGALAVSPLLH